MTLAEKVRERRLQLGMSQDELAKKMGYSSRSSVHKIEHGRAVSQKIIAKLADALGVSEPYLMGYEDRTDESYQRLKAENKLIEIAERPARKIPILGEIACGDPILAMQEYDDYLDLDLATAGDFALRAKGDSMIGARIYNGDIVICKRQEMVNNGEIAVVLLDSEVTLKRFYWYPESQLAILRPENPEYDEIEIHNGDFENVKILGKAVTTIRNIK